MGAVLNEQEIGDLTATLNIEREMVKELKGLIHDMGKIMTDMSIAIHKNSTPGCPCDACAIFPKAQEILNNPKVKAIMEPPNAD